MCGIVGYVGHANASDILLGGLRRVEYRGYDSAGMAVLNGHGLELRRAVGPVAELSEQLRQRPLTGHIGIAHTRWATHGRPAERNAHPQLDQSGRFALVHNGVIENHDAIRHCLRDKGIEFCSETDTEVLVQLIGYLYQQNGNVLESFREAIREVRGTFGLALLSSETPDVIYAARRSSSIVLGIGDDETLVGSDVSAIAPNVRHVTHLADNEIAVLNGLCAEVSRVDSTPINKAYEPVQLDLQELEKGDYPHHMLKEIHHQPESLRNTLRGRLDVDNGKVILGGLQNLTEKISCPRHVLLFGCGTAWHAALIGGYMIEQLAGLPTHVEYASELRYRNPVIHPGTLAIVVSQSGETADSLAALQEVKLKGAMPMGIVNVVGSSIARETEMGVYLRAGPEIGVASTKAFTSQLTVLALTAVELGRRRHLSLGAATEMLQAIDLIPAKIEQALAAEEQVREIAARLSRWNNWLYLGRGVNYPAALEGALKLKEVSYIHAEGMPAAEIKHGPLAMIDPGMPVVVIATRDHTYDKVLSNIQEVRSRQGHVIAIATQGDDHIASVADEVIFVPPTLPLLSPIVNAIPLQLLAYHAAVARGHDVDKPRNLAKSVTVE